MLKVLSLGAGVQSSTILLMVKHGDLEMIDCAIFADTGWEPQAVYKHLEWLESVSPVPIHRVQAGNIRTDAIAQARGEATTQRTARKHSHFVTMPLYTHDGQGKVSMLRRQCTQEYKLKPIIAKEHELLGLAKGQRCRKPVLEQWVGISLDEVVRMKPSRQAWKVHRWPLIDLRMTRWDCLRWLRDHGYPEPPKSACLGCPFHDDRRWREMRDSTPGDWQDVIEVDRTIRRLPQLHDQTFLHAQCRPLDVVDLSIPQDFGQGELAFMNECEGLCGI